MSEKTASPNIGTHIFPMNMISFQSGANADTYTIEVPKKRGLEFMSVVIGWARDNAIPRRGISNSRYDG